MIDAPPPPPLRTHLYRVYFTPGFENDTISLKQIRGICEMGLEQVLGNGVQQTDNR